MQWFLNGSVLFTRRMPSHITIQKTIWQVEWIRDKDRETARRKVLIRKSRMMRFHIFEERKREKFFRLCLAVHLCEKIVRATLDVTQNALHSMNKFLSSTNLSGFYGT